MKKLTELEFNNTYAKLPSEFYQKINPTPFKNPTLISFSEPASRLIEIDPEQSASDEFIEYISGKKLIPGSEPIAMKYTGYQFGVYKPDLGDGRAILLGEVSNSKHEKWDLHLKGSGRTKYSRQFDGRAVLRSTIREYLCSEAMHGLGIRTTRALCIIGSDEPVQREKTETAAMLLRLSKSHVRFGTFEALYHSGQKQHFMILADYVIENNFPHLITEKDKYQLLTYEIAEKSASLVAKWQAYGFTHGVLNTDNMSVIGVTIDYGPYGFIEEYNPGFTPNHSDHFGRYSFENQPAIVFWNLKKLLSCFKNLVDDQGLSQCLDHFKDTYKQMYLDIMRKKLGFIHPQPSDSSFINKTLNMLKEYSVDYTTFFRTISDYKTHGINQETFLGKLTENGSFNNWIEEYDKRIRIESNIDIERQESMKRYNPKYILRNYLAEAAIRKAEDESDFSEINRLHELLKTPFTEKPGMNEFAKQSPARAKNLVISCSS